MFLSIVSIVIVVYLSLEQDKRINKLQEEIKDLKEFVGKDQIR